ncbi:MAG: MFS transporter [Isosphaeraceae bacterium]
MSARRSRLNSRSTTRGYGWVLAAFQLSYAFFQWPAGYLVDRWNVRRTYAGAVLWWSFAGITTAFGHGSNAGHSSGVAGVDARRATPLDPRLARWRLARCCQLDPSHPAALVTREDPGVEPCLIPCG